MDCFQIRLKRSSSHVFLLKNTDKQFSEVSNIELVSLDLLHVCEHIDATYDEKATESDLNHNI